MAGLLYYAPGRTRPLTTADAIDTALRELGLEHLGSSLQSRVVLNHGPDGASGLVLAPGGVDRLGYYPSEQTWCSGPDGKYWIGWYTDDPPTPDDLALDSQLPGLDLALADGHTWTIPLAQHWDGQTELPVIYRLGAGGVEKDVVPSLRPFQKAVEAFLAKFRSVFEEKAEPDIPDDELFDLAGLALSLNYRIGRWEALALGLLQSQRYAGRASVWDVCLATINWPGVMAALEALAEKKRDPEEPGGSGVTGDCPDTAQP